MAATAKILKIEVALTPFEHEFEVLLTTKGYETGAVERFHKLVYNDTQEEGLQQQLEDATGESYAD